MSGLQWIDALIAMALVLSTLWQHWRFLHSRAHNRAVLNGLDTLSQFYADTRASFWRVAVTLILLTVMLACIPQGFALWRLVCLWQSTGLWADSTLGLTIGLGVYALVLTSMRTCFWLWGVGLRTRGIQT